MLTTRLLRYDCPDLAAVCWMRLIQVRRSSLEGAYSSYISGGVAALIRYIPRS